MRKKCTALLALAMTVSMLAACGQQAAETKPAEEITAQVETQAAEAAPAEKTENALADGVYSASFTTDGSMFHINEAYGDRATLTVKDGEMTIHITLQSKNIVNLFPGSAEDAQKEGAVLLQPTTDLVKYSDGTEEEVYGFDVPVPAIDEEFPLALIGTKMV